MSNRALTKQRAKGHENGHTMQEMAARDVHFHLQPMPAAEWPAVESFPGGIWRGLWISVGIGSAVGLLFGYALQTGTLAVEGWEALYSMGAFTFIVFWGAMGAALGGALGGIASLWLTPVREQVSGSPNIGTEQEL